MMSARRLLPTLALAAFIGSYATNGFAQDAIDPNATRILKSMSDYLGKLPAFKSDFDSDVEYVTRTGEKLQISASGTQAVKRPNTSHITRTGGESVGPNKNPRRSRTCRAQTALPKSAANSSA